MEAPQIPWFNKGKQVIANASVSYTADAIICGLTTSSYVFNADHNFLNEITNELSGGGYARQTLGSKTVTEDDTNDRTTFDAADPSFSNTSGTNVNGVFIAKDTGNNATSPLIWYLTVPTQSMTNATVNVVFDTTGFARLTHVA